ncbi:MAG: NUDIX hydrolase [Chloroflexota bacterium]|jgi:8-oxo-dGTP pyrophosphatase MutT (NUDIX family)|nr:NUDIX hydrolase [Chloroflexota bacterium]
MPEPMPERKPKLLDAIDEDEWSALTAAWPRAKREHVHLVVDSPFLTGEHQRVVSDGRRAEICYIGYIGRPDTGLLLHIKSIYPDGAYRLPTGGVRQGEAVLETLAREIAEETGLRVGEGAQETHVRRLLGVLSYELAHRGLGVSYAFATYHFLVEFPAGAVLNPQDPEERIAGWQWRTPVELGRVADTLEATGKNAPYWADWGRWRALSHRFVARALG